MFNQSYRSQESSPHRSYRPRSHGSPATAAIAPATKLAPLASQASDRSRTENPKPWNPGAHGWVLSDPKTKDWDPCITIR
jgi:hypothetical protein